METLTFEYPASKKLLRPAHVGVVGSGDLEVLMEPSAEPFARIEIRTGCCGFGETWKHVMERFFRTHDVAASIRVNDFGATPGIVAMRLAQALEVGQSDEKPEE